MKKLFFIIPFLVAFVFDINAQTSENGRPDDYPDPPKSEETLFFIQRNKNHHTIMYDAKQQSDGKFNSSTPIDAYWLRYYSTGIERRGLKWLERKFAYGYNSKKDGQKDCYWVELAAFNDRKVYLIKNEDKKPIATVKINGRDSILEYIWVYADESGHWPKVIHVDVHGVDIETGEAQIERIKNK